MARKTPNRPPNVTYTIHEHRHRFAAWAASRAASTRRSSFRVEQGKAILEAAGLKGLLVDPDLLPDPPDVDVRHAQWRVEVIGAAKKRDLRLTHGIAAKLINVYFKSRFVCGGFHDHPRVQALHPPIDRLLLAELGRIDLNVERRRIWKRAWSMLDSSEYQELIVGIRSLLGPGRPLWMIEDYWCGHQ